MTSSSRTARCGPACRVVWQGRLQQLQPPYADSSSQLTNDTPIALILSWLYAVMEHKWQLYGHRVPKPRHMVASYGFTHIQVYCV